MKNLNIFSLVTEYENAKSGEVLNVPNVSFVDEDSSVRYLLKLDFTHNGHEYVDLGLPSGLKWATCNVGASSPEEYGLYFAWGETTGYTSEEVTGGVRAFSRDEYDAGSAASISSNLTLEQDAASVNLGGNWRMPNIDDCLELINNCNHVWTADYNGTKISGCIFISKVNGKSIFFPAAGYWHDSFETNINLCGYCWLTSWQSSLYGWNLYFQSNNQHIDYFERYHGHSVRGVFK